ncbi:helix-turn-helix domain protein [Anaeromyxobacter dehalogenans 2CP-1]|uniref:Helix-turn-helix domain protein n=1 Tax=Anaeromyxobacter dehalogenans (strain ATCC BAA-258 / DSM 21875 / 2CP-1) TaxID=455488 RepID=B8J976_ANAD2|nr:helix-turn-helix transcriptional regulator [Anaeromyxobacter dehalogenans]ACL65482.1 helix-turn-helix domain protein [Anaeromyxobacter dehalogenans 2CP-1]
MATTENTNPIRAARQRARLTQLGLAQAAGVHYATIQQGEAGRRLSAATLEKIAGALGLRAEELAR